METISQPDRLSPVWGAAGCRMSKTSLMSTHRGHKVALAVPYIAPSTMGTPSTTNTPSTASTPGTASTTSTASPQKYTCYTCSSTHRFSLVYAVHLVVSILAELPEALPSLTPQAVIVPVLVAVPPSVAGVVELFHADCFGACLNTTWPG